MKLRVENFLSFKELELDFDSWPQLVLLLGDNGAGKTSIFDAFLWVLTGQTSRGIAHDEVISYGQKYAYVELELENYKIIRTRKHPELGNELLLFINGVPYKKPSVNETQKYIETTLFSFKEIITTCYLSQRSLVFDFTDSERKSILANLLKLDSVQKAKELVSKEKNALGKELQQINNLLASFSESLKFEEEKAEEITKLKNELSSKMMELEKLESKEDELSRFRVEYDNILKKIEQIRNIETCPTCLRPLSQKEKNEIIEREEEKLKDLKDKLVELKSIQKKCENISKELLKIEGKLGPLEKQRQIAKEIAKKLQPFKDKKAELETKIKNLEILEQAFSWKGAIVYVLEQLANLLNEKFERFSELIFPEVQPELVLQKTLKSGETRPLLDIVIKTKDRSINYANLSAGEKKRINLVVLFALVELFNKTGFLFCDETFDHLDIEGIEGVVEALCELDLPHVIVTSHSQNLASYFPNVIQVSKKSEGFSELKFS